jgi:hypothetical protein
MDVIFYKYVYSLCWIVDDYLLAVILPQHLHSKWNKLLFYKIESLRARYNLLLFYTIWTSNYCRGIVTKIAWYWYKTYK